MLGLINLHYKCLRFNFGKFDTLRLTVLTNTSLYEKPFDPSSGKHYSAETCHVRVVLSEHPAFDAGCTGVRQSLFVGDLDADGCYLPLSLK